MYVKDHMTANPITINADTPLSKALEIMVRIISTVYQL